MYSCKITLIKFNYFNPGPPIEEVEQGTYADKNAEISLKEYFWTHSLADVFNSLINNGFRIEAFQEYDYSPYKIFDDCKVRGPQEFVFEHNGVSIPHVFSLKAVKL